MCTPFVEVRGNTGVSAPLIEVSGNEVIKLLIEKEKQYRTTGGISHLFLISINGVLIICTAQLKL